MNEIVWSPRAKSDYLNLLAYLQQKWGEIVVRQFAKRLNDQLLVVQQNPNIYPKANKSSSIRRCVVTKQITLYYKRNQGSQIEIITLFDNRQNPMKRPL